MTRGFAPPRLAPRTVSVWFSCYAHDNEDDPVRIIREPLPAVPGQDVARLAVIHARRLLGDPAVYEVIAHRGPHPVPISGLEVIARVCREPFRNCLELSPLADTKGLSHREL